MGIARQSGINHFGWRVDSIGTTRPAAAMGATVTPGNNSKGSWDQVFTALARDCYFIGININASNGANRNMLVDIGVDPAGGSSYSVVIPDLLTASTAALGALSATDAFGCWYYFPLWIPAGATVGARASVNNATVGTVRVRGFIMGSPKYKDRVQVGTVVHAYGITAGTSEGTSVTSGTTSEGAWTSLGSISHQKWWWQVGFGCNDSTMSTTSYFLDLGIGDGSNKFIVIENMSVAASASEAVAMEGRCFGCEYDTPASGQTVYGRLQSRTNGDNSLSMAAYGLGG